MIRQGPGGPGHAASRRASGGCASCTSGDRRDLRDLEVSPEPVGRRRPGPRRRGHRAGRQPRRGRRPDRGVRRTRHHRVHPLRLPAPGGGVLVRRGRAADPRAHAACWRHPAPAQPSAPQTIVAVRADAPAVHARADRSDRRIMTTIAVVTGQPQARTRAPTASPWPSPTRSPTELGEAAPDRLVIDLAEHAPAAVRLVRSGADPADRRGRRRRHRDLRLADLQGRLHRPAQGVPRPLRQQRPGRRRSRSRS